MNSVCYDLHVVQDKNVVSDIQSFIWRPICVAVVQKTIPLTT
jgi:hypothetical protein